MGHGGGEFALPAQPRKQKRGSQSAGFHYLLVLKGEVMGRNDPINWSISESCFVIPVAKPQHFGFTHWLLGLQNFRALFAKLDNSQFGPEELGTTVA